MEVTITHLPNMRITSMFSSPIPGWTEEIPEKEALSLLEKRMYRFMEVCMCCCMCVCVNECSHGHLYACAGRQIVENFE